MNIRGFPEEAMVEMVNEEEMVARSEGMELMVAQEEGISENEAVVIYLKYSCQMEVVKVDVVHV